MLNFFSLASTQQSESGPFYVTEHTFDKQGSRKSLREYQSGHSDRFSITSASDAIAKGLSRRARWSAAGEQFSVFVVQRGQKASNVNRGSLIVYNPTAEAPGVPPGVARLLCT